MAKKDHSINENIDRRGEEDKTSVAINERNKNSNKESENLGFTNVENASASGLGSIGRNDQKPADHDSNRSADY